MDKLLCCEYYLQHTFYLLNDGSSQWYVHQENHTFVLELHVISSTRTIFTKTDLNWYYIMRYQYTLLMYLCLSTFITDKSDWPSVEWKPPQPVWFASSWQQQKWLRIHEDYHDNNSID